MNQIKEDSQASQNLGQVKAKKIKHVLNCLTPTQRKFAMPAAQDKIVYLYFICNCIVKSVACVLMFSCIEIFHLHSNKNGHCNSSIIIPYVGHIVVHIVWGLFDPLYRLASLLYMLVLTLHDVHPQWFFLFVVFGMHAVPNFNLLRRPRVYKFDKSAQQYDRQKMVVMGMEYLYC